MYNNAIHTDTIRKQAHRHSNNSKVCYNEQKFSDWKTRNPAIRCIHSVATITGLCTDYCHCVIKIHLRSVLLRLCILFMRKLPDSVHVVIGNRRWAFRWGRNHQLWWAFGWGRNRQLWGTVNQRGITSISLRASTLQK